MEISLLAMAAFYIFVGCSHFFSTGFFKSFMPPTIPFRMPLIYISGMLEIILGIMLLFENTQSLAAYGIMILLVVVFPGNIYNAVDLWNKKHKLLWLAIVRLPLQIPLIWWASLYR
jgi:uncharacterized membrane protein